MIALFSDWVGNRAILAAIIVSTAVNTYLAVGMLNDLPASQQFFNTLHPYWVQPLVTLIFALAAYLAEACLRTAWAKRTSAWLHRALHGQDDLEKVGWTPDALVIFPYLQSSGPHTKQHLHRSRPSFLLWWPAPYEIL